MYGLGAPMFGTQWTAQFSQPAPCGVSRCEACCERARRSGKATREATQGPTGQLVRAPWPWAPSRGQSKNTFKTSVITKCGVVLTHVQGCCDRWEFTINSLFLFHCKVEILAKFNTFSSSKHPMSTLVCSVTMARLPNITRPWVLNL